MTIHRRATRVVTFIATAAAAVALVQCGSSSPATPTPSNPVSPTVALSSISLSASSVVGGNSVVATIALTAAAPASGAAVSLSGGDPLVVPASVTVPAGAVSATFTIATKPVGATVSSTITGSYGGASASAVLSVMRPVVATASFGVSGETETETCTLTNSGNTLDCTFNGTTSTAPGKIIAYDWTYAVAGKFAQTTTGPVLKQPAVNCTFVPPPPMPPGNPWFTMTVTLTIHDDQGNVATATDPGARLLPQGTCGF